MKQQQTYALLRGIIAKISPSTALLNIQSWQIKRNRVGPAEQQTGGMRDMKEGLISDISGIIGIILTALYVSIDWCSDLGKLVTTC